MAKKFYILEFSAVLASLAYTWLIGIGSVWCWPFAAYASVVFVWLCYKKRIFAEAFLHFFYLLMAVYGYLNWGNETDFSRQMPTYVHLIAIPVLFGLSILSGRLLHIYSKAKAFYLDSFTTVFSIWATWLMVNVYRENWIYFLVINMAAMILYAGRKMWFTTALMLIYFFLAIKGWMAWGEM